MRTTYLGTFIIGFCAAMSAQAETHYKEIKGCGHAVVKSGNTCSNVQVEFTFDGCEIKSPAKIATKVICKDQQIKARLQEDKFRYEAKFEKHEDGWGGVKWLGDGSVSQWVKKEKARVAVAAPQPPVSPTVMAEEPVRAPAGVTPPPFTAPHPETAPNPFKFSGYFDFRYTSFSAPNNPNVSHTTAESGFGLEDGAIYMNYEKEKVSVFADLAFRRAKDVDVNPAAGTPNQSSNANFVFGNDRSQLYLKYRVSEQLVVDIGQFDTIFGVELNDSKDRIFSPNLAD